MLKILGWSALVTLASCTALPSEDRLVVAGSEVDYFAGSSQVCTEAGELALRGEFVFERTKTIDRKRRVAVIRYSFIIWEQGKLQRANVTAESNGTTVTFTETSKRLFSGVGRRITGSKRNWSTWTTETTLLDGSEAVAHVRQVGSDIESIKVLRTKKGEKLYIAEYSNLISKNQYEARRAELVGRK